MQTENNLSQEEEKIVQLEKKIMTLKKEVSHLRNMLPLKEVENYIFQNHNGGTTTLSEIFGDKNELILIHNMGKACVYCTMWADGFNGVHHHLENRSAFVVVSSDDIESQKEFATSRGWKFTMYSSKRTTFKQDMGFEPESGDFQPGVSVFVKDEKGKIFHRTKSRFGPGDNFCNVWDLFDLLPGGSDKWSPKYSYKKK